MKYATFVLDDEVDYVTGMTTRASLEDWYAAQSPGTTPVIDCTSLVFIDVAGVRFLDGFRAQVTGDDPLLLISPARAVRLVIGLAGLWERFRIVAPPELLLSMP